ncbi:CBS domain-containing protein [Nocardiopsis potens]|uniref:CBS domain-containing protein n=1 Tax=Nocardiopsis potens TaxID=1246458 RepID=UPI00034AA01D|nr:CBS domain-containing protein [Nocardiopsis potens]
MAPAAAMRVAEMMSAPAVLLTEDIALDRAARLLGERRCDGAPVVGPDGALVGVVTEIDLLCDLFAPAADPYGRCVRASGKEAPPRRVADVMTRAVITAADGDGAAELAHRMIETRVRCVPVLRGDRVVGVVERRDIARAYLRSDRAIRDDVVAALGGADPLSVTVHGGVVEIGGAGASGAVRATAAAVPGTRDVLLVPSAGTGSAAPAEGPGARKE